MYMSVVALSSMGFSIANASDVLHKNLRNWSAKNEKRTKWDNSTSFFTRVKPLLCFWIDYITAKTKNQLFRQNPAQTQGSVTISNEKKTSCNQELRIEMNHSNPLGANYNSRIIQNFVEWNTWKQKKHNKRLYLRGLIEKWNTTICLTDSKPRTAYYKHLTTSLFKRTIAHSGKEW